MRNFEISPLFEKRRLQNQPNIFRNLMHEHVRRRFFPKHNENSQHLKFMTLRNPVNKVPKQRNLHCEFSIRSKTETKKKMKFVLLLCLLGLTASAPTDPESGSSESGEHHFNETAPEGKVDAAIVSSAPAGARQFGSRDSPTAVTCTTNCEKKWRQEQGLSGSSGSQNWNLNKYCDAHDKFTRCLTACGTSEDKTKWLKRTAKDQWICHDSTYKRNAGCLGEAFKTTAATCDRQDKCGKFDRDDGSLKDMVKQLCSSMKCKLDCRGPTIVSKCGQSAKNDEAGVAKKTAEYLKWRIVDSAGRPNDYPARECDQLIRA